MVKAWWPWAAAALSGLLLALAYPPFGIGGLAWVGLAPLFAALWFAPEHPRGEWKRAFLLGLLAGGVFFVVSLAWLRVVTIPGWLILAAYLALYPAVWAVFVSCVARPRARPGDTRPVWLRSFSNLAAAGLSACAWVALEWVRGWALSGFGWNPLGVALVNDLAMIQIADFTGTGGVSFLLVQVNAIIALTLMRLKIEIPAGRMRPHYDFSLTVVLVATVFAYGARRLLEKPPPSLGLRFAAVQANIPIDEKRDPARDAQILSIHRELSEAAIAMAPDLLIWPEAATPRALFSDRPSWETVRELALRAPGDFLLGTVHYEERGDFNSALLLTERGERAQFYHKMHLVPFGEFVPFRDTFPLFAWIVGDLVPEDFDFGSSPDVLTMSAKPVKIGALICFEDTLPRIARQLALNGAQLFITLTNDAWFLKTAASEQHRANAVLRTVEARRPLVRVANTGVTCAIDIYGRETHRLQQEDGNTFFDDILVAETKVPINPPLTFYTRHGDLFSFVCGGAAAMAALLAVFRRRPRDPPRIEG